MMPHHGHAIAMKDRSLPVQEMKKTEPLRNGNNSASQNSRSEILAAFPFGVKCGILKIPQAGPNTATLRRRSGGGKTGRVCRLASVGDDFSRYLLRLHPEHHCHLCVTPWHD
jgi:hypothetical protein